MSLIHAKPENQAELNLLTQKSQCHRQVYNVIPSSTVRYSPGRQASDSSRLTRGAPAGRRPPRQRLWHYITCLHRRWVTAPWPIAVGRRRNIAKPETVLGQMTQINLADIETWLTLVLLEPEIATCHDTPDRSNPAKSSGLACSWKSMSLGLQVKSSAKQRENWPDNQCHKPTNVKIRD